MALKKYRYELKIMYWTWEGNKYNKNNTNVHILYLKTTLSNGANSKFVHCIYYCFPFLKAAVLMNSNE